MSMPASTRMSLNAHTSGKNHYINAANTIARTNNREQYIQTTIKEPIITQEDINQECPICYTEMDATDLAFHPCPCNYTICIWCFSEINRVSKRCPSCRILYNVDTIRVDPEELKRKEEQLQNLRKQQRIVNTEVRQQDDILLNSAIVTQQQQGTKPQYVKNGGKHHIQSSLPSNTLLNTTRRTTNTTNTNTTKQRTNGTNSLHRAQSYLAGVSGIGGSMLDLFNNTRIIQRNQVYVIGQTETMADKENLKKYEYFGRFGNITKIATAQKPQSGSTNTNNTSINTSSGSATYAAYVTYDNPESARNAIEAQNQTGQVGCHVEATYGTTKYCLSLLRDEQVCVYVDLYTNVFPIFRVLSIHDPLPSTVQ